MVRLAWTITLLELGVERRVRWVPKVAAFDDPARARETKGMKVSIWSLNEGGDVDSGIKYPAFKETGTKGTKLPRNQRAVSAPAIICRSHRDGLRSSVLETNA